MNGTYERHGEIWRAGRRVWTAADDAALLQRYPHEPNAALARDLRRTIQAIYGRAGVLGLVKSAAYLASPHACRLRRGDHVGAAFRYPKGHAPANKGLRRPGWHRGRMKETQFKAGMPSQNTMPIGSTRLMDGYVYRKISDVPNVPYMVNWKPEHILLWTVAARLPLPPRHALRFRNGDRDGYPTRESRTDRAPRSHGAEHDPQLAEAARRHRAVARRPQSEDSTEDSR